MANRYDFTSGFNKEVNDKSPSWMDNLFDKKVEKKEAVIIEDLYSNNSKTVRKCNHCGKLLNDNEISTCKMCKNIK